MKSRNIIGKLLSPHNRGLLLDGFVFLLSLVSVHLASNVLHDFKEGLQDKDWRGYVLVSFFTGILFLSPLGATLKRYGFWARLRAQERAEKIAENAEAPNFSPIFCGLWMYIMALLVGIVWYELILENYLSWTAMFLICFLAPPIYAVVGAWIVRRFFVEPKKAPPVAFLEMPLAAALGDVVIFLNMVCFQALWSLFADEPFRGGGIMDYVFNIIGFVLLMLLFYFPPRNFYLVEDINRPIVWLTIALANLPVFLFLVFGLRIF